MDAPGAPPPPAGPPPAPAAIQKKLSVRKPPNALQGKRQRSLRNLGASSKRLGTRASLQAKRDSLRNMSSSNEGSSSNSGLTAEQPPKPMLSPIAGSPRDPAPPPGPPPPPAGPPPPLKSQNAPLPPPSEPAVPTPAPPAPAPAPPAPAPAPPAPVAPPSPIQSSDAKADKLAPSSSAPASKLGAFIKATEVARDENPPPPPPPPSSAASGKLGDFIKSFNDEESRPVEEIPAEKGPAERKPSTLVTPEPLDPASPRNVAPAPAAAPGAGPPPPPAMTGFVIVNDGDSPVGEKGKGQENEDEKEGPGDRAVSISVSKSVSNIVPPPPGVGFVIVDDEKPVDESASSKDDSVKGQQTASRRASGASARETPQPPSETPPVGRPASASVLEIMQPPSHPPPAMPAAFPWPEESNDEHSTLVGSAFDREMLELSVLDVFQYVTGVQRSLYGTPFRDVGGMFRAIDRDLDNQVSVREIREAWEIIGLEDAIGDEKVSRVLRGLSRTDAATPVVPSSQRILMSDYLAFFDTFALRFHLQQAGVSASPDAMMHDAPPASVRRGSYFGARPAPDNSNLETKARRIALRDTHVGDKVVPKSRLSNIIRWIDSLYVWPPIRDVFQEVRSGLLLCRIVEHCKNIKVSQSRDRERFVLKGVNSRPCTRLSAIKNIELALSVIWKQRVVARNMPTAGQVYKGERKPVARLLNEVFKNFAVHQNGLKSMLHWFNSILKQYNRPLPQKLLHAPHRGLWAAFGGGDDIMCVMHYFCGSTASSSVANRGSAIFEGTIPPVNLRRVNSRPYDVDAVMHNAREIQSALGKAGVFIAMTPEEFCEARDQELLLLQLSSIYAKFLHHSPGLPAVFVDEFSERNDDVLASSIERIVVRGDGSKCVTGVQFMDEDAPVGSQVKTNDNVEGETAPIPPPPPTSPPPSGVEVLKPKWNHSTADMEMTRQERRNSMLAVNRNIAALQRTIVQDALRAQTFGGLQMHEDSVVADSANYGFPDVKASRPEDGDDEDDMDPTLRDRWDQIRQDFGALESPARYTRMRGGTPGEVRLADIEVAEW